MSNGFVMLHRQARDSRVFSDDRAWKLFTYCIMTANHETGYFSGVSIQRGQFATSLRNMADDLGWSLAVLRRTLDKCCEFGCLTTESAQRFTLVTVCNYDTYNTLEKNKRTQEAHGAHTKDTESAREAHAARIESATIEEQQEQQEQQKSSCPDQAPDEPKPSPPKKKPKAHSFTDEDMTCAEWIWERIEKTIPSAKKPNLGSWANSVRLMREIDHRTHHDICQVFKFANQDSFWRPNILSPDKLRAKFDQLVVKLGTPRDGPASKPQQRTEDVYPAMKRPE